MQVLRQREVPHQMHSRAGIGPVRDRRSSHTDPDPVGPQRCRGRAHLVLGAVDVARSEADQRERFVGREPQCRAGGGTVAQLLPIQQGDGPHPVARLMSGGCAAGTSIDRRSQVARLQHEVEPRRLGQLVAVTARLPQTPPRPDRSGPGMRGQRLVQAGIGMGAIEDEDVRVDPSQDLRDAFGPDLPPAGRPHPTGPLTGQVLPGQTQPGDGRGGLGEGEDMRAGLRWEPAGVGEQSGEMAHPRPVAGDEKHRA